MKAAPLVSVIMPTYNRAEFIAQAVESVLAQDYPHRELIIVDDGSTDETKATLAPYRDGPVRLLQQDRQGPGAARNRGLAEARGQLIAFLDSDDFYLPGKLSAQAGILAARKALGAVHSGWRMVDEKGVAVQDVQPWKDAPVLDVKTWLMWKPVFLGGIMIRADWLRKTGGFNPRLYQTDDVELMFRLAAAGCRMAWHRHPTVCYRRHTANITRDGSRQADDLMAAVDSFFASENLSPEIRRLERDVRHYTLLWLAFDLWRKGDLKAMAEHLLRTVPFSAHTGVQLAVSWHSHMIHRGQAFGIGEEQLAGLGGVLSTMPIPGNPAPASVRRILDALYAVWWAEERSRRPDAGSLARILDGYTPREIVKMLQAAIIAVPQRDTLDDVIRLWSDLVRSGVVPASARHEVTTLYLTVFSQSVFRRKGRRAARALAAALRSGAAVRALPAWGRFLRAALIYCFSQKSRKKNTMADVKAGRI
jgi:glycosyltransferase involved in cell wall biosynthesis